MEKHKDKDWLYKKYYDEELSLAEMSELAGCSQGTIRNWMDKYGYERRSISEAHKGIRKIDFFKDWTDEEIKNWLYGKYYDEQLNTTEMAEIAGCSQGTIRRWMNKYGYERRSISEVRIKSDFFENWSDKKIKDWLYKKYYDEELSTYEMAELAGCCQGTIYNWMNKYGYKRRSKNEAKKDEIKIDFFKSWTNERIKDWLYKKYYDEELNTIEMAELAGCSYTTIRTWMGKFGYERRSRSEVQKLKFKDPEERERQRKKMKQAWENGDYNNRKNIYEYTKPNGETIYLDSSWELNYAKSCDKNEIEYKINKKFEWIDENGNKHIYILDFWHPNYNIGIEPHDYYWNEQFGNGKKDFDNKVKKVQEQNNIKIIILNSREKCNWKHIRENYEKYEI